MSEQKNNTPNLRFPEFSGEWEEKTLGEVSPVIFDGTHQTPHYVNSGIPFYSIENIVSDKPCKYIAQDEHMSNTKKNKTEKGDILITRIGTIGFAKIVDWDGEFSTYVSLATIKKSSLINTRYLLGYLQSEVYQKEMRGKSLMNAVPCKINMEDLKSTRIAFPKEQKEQQKIASCLSAMDDLIAAQTEKVEALKEKKTGLMQQLFPQPGETTPRLRFPEFTGDWEYTFGNELFEPITNKNHNSDLPILALTQDQGAVPREMISYNVIVSDKSVAGYKVVEVDDFIISLRSFQGGIEYSRYKGLCSPAYIVLRKKDKNTNSDFYRIYFKSFNYIQALNKNLEGIRDGKMISYSQFSEIKLPSPSPAEQQKIASCLSALDDQIASETKQLEALKDHKKGLMQQLFPQPAK